MHIMNDELRNKLAEMDTNGDGTLSGYEYATYLANAAKTDPIIERILLNLPCNDLHKVQEIANNIDLKTALRTSDELIQYLRDTADIIDPTGYTHRELADNAESLNEMLDAAFPGGIEDLTAIDICNARYQLFRHLVQDIASVDAPDHGLPEDNKPIDNFLRDIY